MLDIRPPDDAFVAAFGDPELARVTLPGAAPVHCPFIELPSRAEYENVGDVSLLDVMTVLAFRVDDVGRAPVGTRIDVPRRSTPWTIRKVYAERDEIGPNRQGWVLVGVV